MIISLANESPVSLGPLRLLPATRELVHEDGRRAVVEPRVMQVLLALIKADGAIVTRSALTESCWQGRIVGEDAINRVISRLRQVAREIGAGVFRIETITQIGYRLISTAVLKQSGTEPSTTSNAAVPVRRPRWARWAALAAVLAGVAIAVAWQASQSGRPGPSASAHAKAPQLRILPFTSLSGDVRPALIAQAHEEIVAAFGLTSFVDVVTASPSAAPGPLTWTLSGAVGRSGPDLHFVIHLTHDSTGKVVWSTVLDRPAAEGDRALKGVAAAVEEIVATSLTAAARYQGRGELPDSTLALFIQWSQDTVLPVGRFRHGEEELRRAVAQTPDFADGWSWLAGALGATATASDDATDAAAARAAAPPVIAAALRLRPNDAVALMARAKVVPPGDFLGREAAFRAAIAVPVSEAGVEHSAYSVFLMNVGRHGEAVRQADIGYELDQLSPSLMDRYAKALSYNGQAALADKVIAQILLVWPQDPGALQLRVRSALWTHDEAAAVAALRADTQTPPAVRAAMLRVFAALRSGSPARRAAAADMTALARDPATLSPFTVSALAALGDAKGAVAAADRLIAAHSAISADVLFDPAMADARRTPEFAALAGRIGLTDYWRKSGRMPDFCATAGAPAICAGLR